MKRVFILLIISLSIALRYACAQDPVPTAPPPNTAAADIAAQQAEEERNKRLAADMQALQLDNESLKAKIASLEQRIDELRQQLAAAANNTSVQEDLKRLAEKITEVDKKREEDKQSISDEIRKSMGALQKALTSNAAPIRLPSPKMPPPTEAPSVEGGIPYTVQEGDTLSAIVKQFNIEFKSKGWKTITIKQAKEANPAVDWDRLRVGQKIIIPHPEGQ